jgi:hypothetical protein
MTGVIVGVVVAVTAPVAGTFALKAKNFLYSDFEIRTCVEGEGVEPAEFGFQSGSLLSSLGIEDSELSEWSPAEDLPPSAEGESWCSSDMF